jgi:hypothetical protein
MYKAWMSGRDQDIFHKIVFNVSKIAKTPNILEWGSGQSTIFFTSYLNSIGVDYKWCSLEYNQEFFDTKLYPVLQKETKAKLVWRNPTWDMGDVVTNENGSGLIRLFCFPHGDVKPFSNYADRSVNMDDYVDFPSSLGEKFDLIFVDGRKRRRCQTKHWQTRTGPHLRKQNFSARNDPSFWRKPTATSPNQWRGAFVNSGTASA